MKIIVLLFLGFLLISCKKKHTVHIKAINAITGQPYANLPYSIKGTKTGSNGEKLVFEHLGTLNSNGEASPNIKVNENLTFHVGVTKPPNNCYQKDINFFWDAKANSNPTFQFEYAECANMKFKIKNINCQGPNDHFKLYYLGRQVAGQGTLFNGGLSVDELGCFDFEWPEFSQVPIGERYYKWEVTKNSITNTFYDTINLSENQFFIYEINY